MAAGDPIVSVGTIKTLEANGASITSGSVVQADDAVYNISTDASNWPDAEFTLTCTFGTSPTEGRVLNLLARPMAVDGVNNTQIPEASRPTWYVGSFVVNNIATVQTMYIQGGVAYDLPRNAQYYLHNDTDQTVSAGWVLKVLPRNVIPALI